jgi:hypothetical protein
MLGKAASKEGKNWDELLPYLLFENREVLKPLWAFPPSNWYAADEARWIS